MYLCMFVFVVDDEFATKNSTMSYIKINAIVNFYHPN